MNAASISIAAHAGRGFLNFDPHVFFNASTSRASVGGVDVFDCGGLSNLHTTEKNDRVVVLRQRIDATLEGRLSNVFNDGFVRHASIA